MHLDNLTRRLVRAALALLVCSIAVAQTNSFPQPGGADKSAQFDGKWRTKLTCPEKRNTQGYTWLFDSVIQKSVLRGEHGIAGEPGYLLIEGKIADDGSAKLSANGLVASRKYARGVFTRKSDEYSYDIKAQFSEREGRGTRNEGLGIVGRPCIFEFSKQ